MTYMVGNGNLMKLMRKITNDLYIFRCCCFDCNYANQKWMEVVMDYKEIMDIWFVWLPAILIFFKYVKGVVSNWNEDTT